MKKKIIIIDDQPAAYLPEILRDKGFGVHVFTAFSSNEDEILSLIESNLVEFVLVDYSLGPEEPSGSDIVGWLIDNGFSGTIIGINTSEDNNKQMLAKGASFHINKYELVDKVSSILIDARNPE